MENSIFKPGEVIKFFDNPYFAMLLVNKKGELTPLNKEWCRKINRLEKQPTDFAAESYKRKRRKWKSPN